MDIHSKETRSYNMSCIHGKDTKPEEIVRKFLFSNGFRYRKNDKRYPGTPDIVLPRYKTVIFVNGCFWHGHECCRYFVVPKSNTEFWVNKINRNKERDKQKTALLEGMGWNVIVLWECQLKKSTKDATLSELLLKLTCKSG
ncbi:MAG: DNA mismatch endonuclease Vsr [Lachnospiraceae bacterium]|nr:DNA mismatch endonuclease Vsr [Lachnospiraceae bacterium]